MSTYSRQDSSRPQMRVHVPTSDGSRAPLLRSAGPVDLPRVPVVSDALQALADGIHEPQWLRVKRLVEDVFLAAGLSIPLISREALPVLRPVGQFITDYLARRRKTVKWRPSDAGKLTPSHYALMKRCLTEFSSSVAGLELSQVKGHHVQAWVDALADGGGAPGTVRNQLSVVSALFSHAVDLGFISVNPCSAVEVPDAGATVMRLPMPDEDFEKLTAYLRAQSLQDWLTVVMLARHAGLRLLDASRVTFEAVSWPGDACLLEVLVGKTGNAEVMPVFEPLAAFLKALPGQQGNMAPSLCGLSASVLSRDFSALCDLAQIDPQAVELPNGRKHRRISFHSLRHCHVTDLSRRGIPQALRMKLSAHTSEASHNVYDHTGALDLYRQVAPYFTASSASTTAGACSGPH